MYSMNTEWLRELTAFIAVASTAREAAARFTRAAASSDVVIVARVAPTTVDGPPENDKLNSLLVLHQSPNMSQGGAVAHAGSISTILMEESEDVEVLSLSSHTGKISHDG